MLYKMVYWGVNRETLLSHCLFGVFFPKNVLQQSPYLLIVKEKTRIIDSTLWIPVHLSGQFSIIPQGYLGKYGEWDGYLPYAKVQSICDLKQWHQWQIQTSQREHTAIILSYLQSPKHTCPIWLSLEWTVSKYSKFTRIQLGYWSVF